MKRSLTTLAFLFLVICIADQKNWSPEQSLKIKNIKAVVPSPDAGKVLYTVREAVMTDDRSEYINQVWLCNADARPDDQVGRGSNSIQLTKGDKNSSNPKWSPNGLFSHS